MKIKTKKIHIFNESDYQDYKVFCDFLNKYQIEYYSFSDFDDDDNPVWCVVLECE